MRDILDRVIAGNDLSLDEMATVVGSIMDGEWQDEDIAILLLALRDKGETVEEVAGAAAAMRSHMTPIRTSRTDAIDTCGTGGDGSGTFNISTAAALVTAAAGVPVAKHGNRSITSKTGSADVLGVLGVNIDADVPTVERCLDKVGICFCFAPNLHPSMKYVARIRRKLGVPTIFNLLGPLCNPAAARFQLLGVGKPALRPLLSAALALLGTERALVVCGEDGLDEVTLSGMTHASEVTDGQTRDFVWSPEEFGLQVADMSELVVDGPAASAQVIREVLSGKIGPARDIVVLNAAAALWTAGWDETPKACAQRSSEAIDSGAAADLLARLAEESHS